MQADILQGILIPFFGTALVSACVLFLKKGLNTMLAWHPVSADFRPDVPHLHITRPGSF